jgi:spore coat polysaccharide biosynthesis protein SpsF
MNTKIIIQARMTSTRLPAKVMLTLCGKSVLEVMLERLSEFKENIIIATTNEGSQAPIVELCKRLHVKHFEGNTDDVLARYFHAASKYGASDEDIIVRCTSDCPLIDPEIIKETITYFKNSDAEYVCACQNSGFPRGLDTEVFTFKHLKEAYENAISEHHKEHVTPYVKENVKCASYHNRQDHSKYRLTLDEADDYKAITALYEKLNCRTDFTYQEMIAVLEANPEIYEMNKHVEQKKHPHTR